MGLADGMGCRQAVLAQSCASRSPAAWQAAEVLMRGRALPACGLAPGGDQQDSKAPERCEFSRAHRGGVMAGLGQGLGRCWLAGGGGCHGRPPTDKTAPPGGSASTGASHGRVPPGDHTTALLYPPGSMAAWGAWLGQGLLAQTGPGRPYRAWAAPQFWRE